MAALVASQVKLNPERSPNSTDHRPQWWYPAGKDDRNLVAKSLELNLSGQGGLTNTIGAAALGFKVVFDATNAWGDDTGLGYPVVVFPSGLGLWLLNGSNAPADVTDTVVTLVVTGIPA